MLAAHECPTVHLEMRKIRRWQDATKFKKFCSFKLNIPPAWMTVTKPIVGV